MNKKDLIKIISKKNGFVKEDIEKVIDSIFDTILESLKNDEEIYIHGFGRFYTEEIESRKRVNPKTHEEFVTPGHKVAKFRYSQVFRNYIRTVTK